MTVRRLAGVALGVVLMLTICAGSVALAIVAFPLADYQTPDEPLLRDEMVAAVSRTTRRTAPASVELKWSAARRVEVGDAAGKVTAMFAAPGEPLACGAPVVAVDGSVVWALCGNVPLWRDVTATTKGADADAVADLLIGLGQLSAEDRSDGRRRTDAWKGLQRYLGQPVTGVFRPSDAIFIGEEITPSRVLVNVGDRVSNDSDLLEVDSVLQSATVLTATGNNPDLSGWVFTADGSANEFPVSRDGSLEAGDFEEVAAATRESTDAALPTRIQGSVRLVTPISLVGVPPSALVTAPDGSTCVELATGGTVPVKIVESATGMVMLEADLAEGTSVRNLPPAGTTC